MCFEKLVSGMYMGEIACRIMLKLAQEGSLFGGRVPQVRCAVGETFLMLRGGWTHLQPRGYGMLVACNVPRILCSFDA